MSFGLKEWVRPICYCEIDPYCQGVLLSRFHTGELPRARIWDDISTLPTCGLKDDIVDIIYGGFPCQDISIGGNGKGLEGERSGLFYQMVRLAQEIKPEFIFIENVPAITARGGMQVVRQITELGYECRWCVIPASKWVDQRRERWFLLAKSCGLRREKGASERIQEIGGTSLNEKSSNYKLSSMDRWASYARGMREANGVPRKVDRVRALGNAVVPRQAKEAFKILMGLK
jgi:DNA (cytosine-5)-methyltransferase 1